MRIRSKKFLSGASAIAIMAAFGTVSPALAASNFPGPNTYDPIVNDQPDSASINTDATVRADATTNDSFFNGLAMTAAGANLTVNDSYLLGDIVNTNTMSSGANAIDILNDSQIGGQIFNSGSIGATAIGISIVDDSTLADGIFNSGSITGGTAGVSLGDDSEIFDGIENTGHISGAIGIRMIDAQAELHGGIENDGTASAIIGTATGAIQVTAGTLNGGISNEGVIRGTTTADGIIVTGGTIAGGIANAATGTIEVTGTAVTAIEIANATFNGDITNSGDILADAALAVAIRISGTTDYNGNITNNSTGLISASSTAIIVSNATFDGTISNAGQITSANAIGVNVSSPAFTGNIANQTGGTIAAELAGIQITSTLFTGNVTNDGRITSASADGVVVNAATFQGNLANSGVIIGDDNGLVLTGAAFNGTVTNTGDITGTNDAVRVETGTTLTGNLVNSGDIVSTNQDGIDVNGAIVGTIVNQAGGIIDAQRDGIDIDGSVSGGITNAGTIIGETGAAIDVSGSAAAHTITQTAGLIRGGNGVAVGDALDLGNGQADTFNANGGTLDGNVIGGAADGDDFLMAPSGSFAYLRGTASDLDQFDMTGAGTAVLGASARGATGAGVTVNAATMTHGGEGTVYLDDDTTVNLTGDYTQTDGTLEFHLTSDVTTHGQINATGNANLGGRIAAYIQGDTFGSVGGDTFTYQDVITGTTAGTFTNAGTIDTNSIFFEGIADVNATDVDIILTRQSFIDALALPGLTQNQMAVGGALEEIYSNGGYGSDFEDLYNYLLSLGAGQEEEVAHIYDELAAAEHADLQEAGLRVSHAFVDIIGERIDDMKSAGHASLAELGLRRYAAADAKTATDGTHGAARAGASVWGRAYGAWTESDGDAEAAAYDQHTGGFAGGVDFAIDKAWSVGGAIGWSSSDIEFATAGDEADLDSFQFAAYGAFESGRFYGDAIVSFGFHDVASTRFVDLGFDTLIAQANYDASTFGVHGEFGGVFDAGRVDIQPFVALGYLSNSTDGFAEAGAGDFGLLVGDSDADSLASTVGVRFSGSWQAGGVRLIPDAEIAWRHEFLDERQAFTAAFIEDPTTPFQIVSSELSQDSALVNAGLGAQVAKGLVLFVDYHGVLNSAADTHAASAGFRASW